MASHMYGPSLSKILDQSLSLTTAGIKFGLSTATHVPDKDHEFLDENDADTDEFVDGELDGTGYAPNFGGAGRHAVVSPAVAYDTANDRVEFDGDDALWSTIGPGTGTAVHLTLLREITSDILSPIIAEIDIADTVPNGGDITIQFDAEGIIQFPV